MSSEDLIYDRLRAYIDAHDLLDRNTVTIVGVSGGLDSISLLEALTDMGFAVEAAHVNYRLRKEASDADEQLVREYCRRRKIRLSVLDAGDIMARRPGGVSVQEHARTIRYNYFHEIASDRVREDDKTRVVVALAHHADDQIETIIMNLDRKTGLDGLAGMRPSRPLSGTGLPTVSLVRPFLGLRKEQIRSWAEEKGIRWREDESNNSPAYTRTHIRRERVPSIQAEWGDEAVEDIVELAEVTRTLLDERLPGMLSKELHFSSMDDPTGGGRVPLGPLEELDESIRRWFLLRCVRRWLPGAPVRRSTVVKLEALIGSDPGKRLCHERGSIWRERDVLRFVASRNGRDIEQIVSIGQTVEIMNVSVNSEWLERAPDNPVTGGKTEIYLDADKVTLPLKIRVWNPGDRIYPFGLEGSVKVKALLTDAKVPPSDKSDVVVLVDSHRVLWVVGYRASRHASIGPSTGRVIRFSVEAAQGLDA
jgi:tRNA(Ile)-lysidine synthase